MRERRPLRPPSLLLPIQAWPVDREFSAPTARSGGENGVEADVRCRDLPGDQQDMCYAMRYGLS
jgi:hypothetical protein